MSTTAANGAAQAAYEQIVAAPPWGVEPRRGVSTTAARRERRPPALTPVPARPPAGRSGRMELRNAARPGRLAWTTHSMRSMRMPDPSELGTPAGWRRAQQIRYHAWHGRQWGVVADVTVAMAQHLASENEHKRAEELLNEIHQDDNRYDALSRAGAAVQLATIHSRTGRADS